MSSYHDHAGVLIAGDNRSLLDTVAGMVGRLGYSATVASGREDTLAHLSTGSFGAILLGMALNGTTGSDLLRFITDNDCIIAVIMVSGTGEIDQLEQCIRMGAYDYLAMPIDSLRLEVVLKHALSETALRQKVRLLSAAVDQSPVGVVITDVEGHIEYANPSFLLHRDCSQDACNPGPMDVDAACRSTGLPLVLRNVIASGKAWEGDFCDHKDNGALCWEHAIISPVTSQGEAGSHMLALIEDITVMRRNQEALLQSTQRFRELADLLPQTVFETDRKGLITYSNKAGFVTFGYSRIELKRGLHALQFFDINDRKRVLNALQAKRFQSRSSGGHEFMVFRRDGTGFPALVYIAPITDRNGPSGYRGIVVDITDLKKSERKLQENQQKYLNLFQAIPDAIIVVDTASSRLLEWNRQAQLFFGYEQEELDCLHIVDLFSEDRREDVQSYFGTLSERASATLETQVVTRQGLQIDVHLTSAMFVADRIPRFVAIFRDISEQKKSERLIRENIRLKNDFISTVSHELRTPLFSILGFTGTLLQEQDELDRATRMEFLSIIHDESKRLSSLIEDVLMISRIDSGRVSYKKSDIDPSVTVSEVCRNLKIRADEKKIELHLKVSVPARHLYADPDALKQVAINIIGNALKFTPSGGRVDVLLSYDEHSMLLSVRDNGPGIPETELEKVFEKFYRAGNSGEAVDGTGLGLAIAREIVEAHEGSITVQSILHKGTDFLVRLPLLETHNHQKQES